MGVIKNTVDLGKALGHDFLTSTSRFNKNFSDYFAQKSNKKSEIYRELMKDECSERELQAYEDAMNLNAKVGIAIGHSTAFIGQLIVSGMALYPFLMRDDGVGTASMVMVIAGTAMATNDPMMRGVEKLSNDIDQIKEKLKEALYGEAYIPLEFEYDKQRVYPKTREVWRNIRSGGDHYDGGDPPSDNSPEI